MHQFSSNTSGRPKTMQDALGIVGQAQRRGEEMGWVRHLTNHIGAVVSASNGQATKTFI